MNPTARAQALSGFLGFLSQRQVTEAQAAQANRLRDDLLERLQAKKVQQSFFGSKLYTGELSPGCSTCGAGTWSCVYLTKQCTANCFFCPSEPGLETSLPRANRIPLPNLEAFLALLRLFAFQGVSFSGGEPLLRFEELLTWITHLKQEFGAGLYVWIYTNGDLVDEVKLRELNKAGLDEIRINIRARDYELEPVILARESIRTVTVEIPTLPEDYPVLKERIADLNRLGVDHINLHQLFANPANYRALSKRDYTFLPLVRSASPVLESEMVALRLLLFTLENRIDLPINYCSLVYRTRCDELAHRRRAASLAKGACESPTEAGYLRRLSVSGPARRIRQIDANLQTEGYSPSLWRVADGGSRLLFHPSLLASPEFARERIEVQYFEAEILPKETELRGLYQPAGQIKLGPGLQLWIGERLISTPVFLSGAELAASMALGARAGRDNTDHPCEEPIEAAERMACGLQKIRRVSSLLEVLAE